ncbi:hypothetical protein ACWNT8_15780 (plasmid) [Pigmentibacter ruber]
MSKKKSLYLKYQKPAFREELKKLKIEQTVKQIEPQFVEAVSAGLTTLDGGEKLSDGQRKGLAIMLIKLNKINDADFAQKEIAHILDRENKIKPEKRGRDTSLPSAPNFLLYHIDKRVGGWTRKLLAKCLKEPQLAKPAFIAHACGSLRAIGKEKAETLFKISPELLYQEIFKPENYEKGFKDRTFFLRMQALGNVQRKLIREKKLKK